ncbi:MAG TPA: hypothetical protein VMU57_08790 [Edaphobacter sp.]|uniref:hypothetical protein n=1 Tax=Edaphobacter sp. TaxID=1934404 RepID=UPI002B9077D4|nr:hypothetical protein [Edaphobacter sp.]HUZ94996.1 hypothetical protein [Edaphobacter sp.]
MRPKRADVCQPKGSGTAGEAQPNKARHYAPHDRREPLWSGDNVRGLAWGLPA